MDGREDRVLMETASFYVVVISVLVSLIAVLLSYHAFRKTLREGVRPVLIFSRRSGTLWQIQNVGSGPAISLVVADRDTLREWRSSTKCYPLSAGAAAELVWIAHGTELVARYRDVNGAPFTTVFRDGINEVSVGHMHLDLPPPSDEWFARIAAEEGIEGGLTEQDLRGKSTWELDVMRNEIYARHGFTFKRRDLRDHFSGQPWYVPQNRNQFKVYEQFSVTEKYNVEFIRQFQIRHGLMRKR